MKKVLALVLAVVMVCGMAAIATSAATTASLKITVNGETVQSGADVENGDEVVVEVKDAPSDASFKVDLKEQDDCPDGAKLVLKEQEGKKFTFTVVAKPTTIYDFKADYSVVVTAINKAASDVMPAENMIADFDIGVAGEYVVPQKSFSDLKDANKDATIKASLTYGKYLTITDVQNAKDINIQTVNTPDEVKNAEALKGVNYVFAGYKYAQELPGVSTMKIDLNASMMLTGAKEVYVYQYNNGTLTLYPSTAENKAWEVKDGAVKFDVSTTGQWVVTDKQLSGSTTSNNTNTNTNPGTGANDMIGAAVVMALVAAAGVVAFKK